MLHLQFKTMIYIFAVFILASDAAPMRNSEI